MQLETVNLTLRTVIYDDIDEVMRMWNFEKGELSHTDAKKAIDNMINNHNRNKIGRLYHLCFAIYEDNNKIIGWCGLDGIQCYDAEEKIIHIFYLIDRDYRRKGYAVQCAEKLLEYGFLMMKVDKINGSCIADNIGSKKVLEKIGMKHKTIAEDGAFQYYLTRSEYQTLIKYEKNYG